MTTITIEAEEELMAALRQVAQNQATTIEAIVKDTLRWHLPSLPATDTAESAPLPMDAVALRNKYPFIGSWQTGNSDLSERTEDLLPQPLNHLPNAETQAAIEESYHGQLKAYPSLDQMWAELGQD